MKLLRYNEFKSQLNEARMSVSEPVGIAVLGAPAGGKSTTLDKIKASVDDARLKKTLSKGVEVSVDNLRSEFQSRDPEKQILGFIHAFYLMQQKAREDEKEYGQWYTDIYNMWKNKFSELLPSLDISIQDDKLMFGDKESLEVLDLIEPDIAKEAIDALDNYSDYKRVVRWFQHLKQEDAVTKQKGVSFDEVGDESGKIIKQMKTLHDNGYVTDVIVIQPDNVATNIIQNFGRVVVGGDGGRDSSANIVASYLEMKKQFDVYKANAEVELTVKNKDLDKVNKEFKDANVKDDKSRGNKPIDVFATIKTVRPNVAYTDGLRKLKTKERQDIFRSMIKYAALTLKNLPKTAKDTLIKLTNISNDEALQHLKNAAASGEYVFKYGGVDDEYVKKAEIAFEENK